MENPKVIATLTSEGIKVELKNWDGVSNVMVERIHYAIVKESQIHRAQKLGAMYKDKMQVSNNETMKEFENVLAK